MNKFEPKIYAVTVEPHHVRSVARLFQKALNKPDAKGEILATTAGCMIAIAEVLMAWIGNAEAVEKTMENAVANAIETVIRDSPSGMR